MRPFVALFLALLLLPSTGFADQLEDGKAAIDRQDYSTALNLLHPLADQGNADALNSLAFLYQSGQGVKLDYAEAMKLYRKAADQGYAKAEYNIGLMYEVGKGVKQNYTESAKWYRMASDQGMAEAQNNLSNLYENGNGVAKNEEEAFKLLQKAADQGNPAAQANLGNAFYKGMGVYKDDTEAVVWWRKAADQGLDEAKDALRRYYEHSQANQQHEATDLDLSMPSTSDQAHTTDNSSGTFFLWMFFVAIFGMIGVWWRSRPAFDPRLLTDTTRPEPERRMEVVRGLIKKGWIVQNQQSGFITAVKQKERFDILGFIVLSLLCLFPGIIYLIYYATKRDKIQQYVLMQ
jgi:hypothetical protein